MSCGGVCTGACSPCRDKVGAALVGQASSRVFPVQGGAGYRAEFYPAAILGPDGETLQRQHLGIDLFAPEGTPLLATDDGTVRFGTDTLGGQVANLYAQDGTRYYYAHLSSFEGSNRPVRAGEVIGYVGTTGNARGKPPHTHFEAHPGNGPAVDPYPILRASRVVQRQAPGVSSASEAFPPWLVALVAASAFGGLAYLYATQGRRRPSLRAAFR